MTVIATIIDFFLLAINLVSQLWGGGLPLGRFVLAGKPFILLFIQLRNALITAVVWD